MCHKNVSTEIIYIVWTQITMLGYYDNNIMSCIQIMEARNKTKLNIQHESILVLLFSETSLKDFHPFKCLQKLSAQQQK